MQSNYNSNRVFCRISPGKTLLSDAKAKDQSAQKGPNCWYYAYNSLRLRLGKSFDVELPILRQQLADLENSDPMSEIKEHQQLLSQLEEMRSIEKIISAHRKRITHFSFREEICRFLLEQKNISTYKKSDVNFLLRLIEQAPSRGLRKDDAEEIKIILNDFANNLTFNVFKDYLLFVIRKCILKIDASYKTLFRELNADEASLQKEVTEFYTFFSMLDLLDKLPKEIIIAQMGKVAALKKYGLLHSQWKDVTNFSELMEALRVEGPLAISGYVGRSYFPHVLQHEAPYQHIHYWDNIPPLDIEIDSHVILLIGAEIKNNQQYVYFIDPSDSSPANTTRKIYQLPFDILVERMRSIHGYSLQSSRLKALAANKNEVALCSDQKQIALLKKQYTELKQFLTRAQNLPLPRLFQPEERRREESDRMEEETANQVNTYPGLSSSN